MHGQPNIDNIVQLLTEVKRNAQTVKTILGGGKFGYLALVISTTDYNTIPDTVPFVWPVHPGIFDPNATVKASVATRASVAAAPAPIAAEIMTRKLKHDKELRHYNECQAVGNTLCTQIQKAIEEDYLTALRDSTTDLIISSIPDIFICLRNIYGKLSPSQLCTRETQLKGTVYDPSKNPDFVFNKIWKFQTLCQLLQKAKTDAQLVDHAYIIF